LVLFGLLPLHLVLLLLLLCLPLLHTQSTCMVAARGSGNMLRPLQQSIEVEGDEQTFVAFLG
jgi:hypothetical protein